jgi:DNA polymerase III epsilon subunit-like protein
MNLLAIDFETTGLCPYDITPEYENLFLFPHIVQVGLASRNGSFSAVIKPTTEWVMSPAAEAVHGYSIADCQALGVDLLDIFGIMKSLIEMKFAKNEKVFDGIVCHNADYDMTVLKAELMRHGYLDYFKNVNVYCTQKQTLHIKQTHQNGVSFDDAAAHYGIARQGSFHDATEDARLCLHIFNHSYIEHPHLFSSPYAVFPRQF